MDREFAGVPATPRNVPQGPGPFVGKLRSFETKIVIPVACGNLGEVDQSASGLLCVLALTQASWFPVLRVPSTSSDTVSSYPDGDEPCLLLLPVGLRPSSSAA
jgi:hypothetical protein